jgi:hypothetical protein
MDAESSKNHQVKASDYKKNHRPQPTNPNTGGGGGVLILHLNICVTCYANRQDKNVYSVPMEAKIIIRDLKMERENSLGHLGILATLSM